MAYRSTISNKKRFIQLYNMGKIIGDGNFSVVKECIENETGKKYAVKCIKKASLKQKDIENIHQETNVLRELNHSNIIKLIDVIEEGDMVYIIMELVTGGELFDRIIAKEHYTEAEAKYVVRTVADVLIYCHNKGIAHRDLKPENLLYENNTSESPIKIADFGFAKIASDNVIMSTMCGTPGYFAPEVITRKPYEHKCDIWSLGVITYILLSGFPPFYDDNQIMEMEKIRKGDYSYPSPYFDQVSNEAKDLIDHMLVVDPDKRFNANQVLEHPWLKHTANHVPSKDEIDKLPNLNHVSTNLYQHKDMIKSKFKAGVDAILALNRTKRILKSKRNNM